MSRFMNYFSKTEIILWVMASMQNQSYISVVVCFAAFLANDIYGFVNWKKIERSQKESE